MVNIQVGKYCISITTDSEELEAFPLSVLSISAICKYCIGEQNSRNTNFVSISISSIYKVSEILVQGWFEYGYSSGFHQGVLIIPETDTVFIGICEKTLTFDLITRELIEDQVTHLGFWSWKRYDNRVIMAAELEIAIWSLTGHKVWSQYVEPPWDYELKDNLLILDVMGCIEKVDLNKLGV